MVLNSRHADPSSDSPSTVPPYSNQNSPAPHYPSGGWTNPVQQQGFVPNHQVHEADDQSQVKPYPPQDHPGSAHVSYGPSPRFSPPLSQNSDPLRSSGWSTSSTGVPPRKPVGSRYDGQGFARVHQGPPQELGGDEHAAHYHQNVGLGVHHIQEDSTGYPLETPPAELDVRLDSQR